MSLALAQTVVPVPPLTVARVFTAWRFQPGVVAVVALLGGGYGLGLRARRRRTGAARWPAARTACFAVGVALIAVVGLSFIGVYDDTLFWTRAVRNVVLLMLVPMLLALGAPLTLARDLLAAPARARLSRLLHSPPARVATAPLVVTVVLVLPLLVLYLSPLYELTLRSAAADGLAASVITVTGFVYFWTRFSIDPTPRAGSYGLTLVITIVDMIGDAVLGVVLWLGPLVAQGYYAGLARDWGPSLRTDQLLGAGVIWVGGDVIGMPFIAIVVSRMMREDQHRASRIDAELDALDEAYRAVDPGPVADATGTASAGPEQRLVPSEEPARLWWEDHPDLAERFRRP